MLWVLVKKSDIGCWIFGQVLSSYKPQFPHLDNGDNNSLFLAGIWGEGHDTMSTKCLACPECDEWLFLVVYKHRSGPQETYSFTGDGGEVKRRIRWKSFIPKRGWRASEEERKLWVAGSIYCRHRTEAKSVLSSQSSQPTLDLTHKSSSHCYLIRSS